MEIKKEGENGIQIKENIILLSNEQSVYYTLRVL